MTSEELLIKLEQARLARGLNVTDFSSILGISYQSYYDWKNGKIPKTIKTFISFLNFCKEENLL